MKPAIFHSAAEAEFLAALDYYESQREGLGGEFRTEVEAAVERIRQNPELYAAESDQDARPCPVHRFPYTIFYVEFEERIWVAAVAHQRRRPRYWSQRSPE